MPIFLLWISHEVRDKKNEPGEEAIHSDKKKQRTPVQAVLPQTQLQWSFPIPL